MIYTVTLNPSLDHILEAPALHLGQVNRIPAARMAFGGKGISQSVILTALGIPNCAVGFAGGYTGQKLRRLLQQHGVQEQLVEIDGETRINIKIRAGQETELNTPGPLVGPEDCKKLLAQLERLQSGDVLSFGGSVPPGIPPTVIHDILTRLQGRGIFTAVDADGELLRLSLAGRPCLVKPNRQEAAALLGMTGTEPDFARQAALRIQAMGAQNVLLSLGGDGAALLTQEGEFFLLRAPQGKVRGTTGAGDSLLAGFLAGRALGLGWFAAFHLGVAAGSATAFAGRLATREEIDAVQASMKMRGVETL